MADEYEQQLANILTQLADLTSTLYGDHVLQNIMPDDDSRAATLDEVSRVIRGIQDEADAALITSTEDLLKEMAGPRPDEPTNWSRAIAMMQDADYHLLLQREREGAYVQNPAARATQSLQAAAVYAALAQAEALAPLEQLQATQERIVAACGTIAEAVDDVRRALERGR